MKKLLVLLVLFILAFSFSDVPFTEAIDLNAPGQKKITIKSEIRRGYEAVFSVCQPLDILDLLGKLDAIEFVFTVNSQKNTDSPGFLLGANFSSWSTLSMDLQVMKGKSVVPQRQYDLVLKFAKRYFSNFRSLQKQLKINDQQLMDIIGFKQPLMNDIYKWDYQDKYSK